MHTSYWAAISHVSVLSALSTAHRTEAAKMELSQPQESAPWSLFTINMDVNNGRDFRPDRPKRSASVA